MDKLTERLFEINKRKAEIRSLIEKNDKNTKLDDLDKELKALNEDEQGIEKRVKLVDGIVINKPKDDQIESKSYDVDSAEYRNAFFKRLQGRKDFTEVEKRALDTAGVAGAIPTQTADQFIEKMKQIAPMLNEIQLLQIPGNIKWVVEGVRDDAAIHTENSAITPASDETVTITLGGFEFVKVVPISIAVQTMAVNAFESWIVNILAEDVARQIENKIINGSGTNEPIGIDKANTWNDTNSVTVALASSLTYQDVCNLDALLDGGYDNQAKILMSKKTLAQDFIPLMDKSKHDLVIRNADGSYSVLGYPVLLSSYVPAHNAYLGDFTKYVGNMSKPITVDSSADSGFRNASIDFRGIAVFDGKPAIGAAFVKLIKATA